MGESSKRSKVSVSSGYLPSSSLGTPIEVEEYDTPSPMSRSIGQQVEKRKRRYSAFNNLDLLGMGSVTKDKNDNITQLIMLKESQEICLQKHEKAFEV